MRGNRVNLKNVPTGAWVFASVGLVSVLGALVVLTIAGADTADIRWVILAILNAGGGLATVGNIVYSGAAAKNAQQTVEQTNGVQASERQAIANAAAVRALTLHTAATTKQDGMDS
jgi:hypothetical protein